MIDRTVCPSCRVPWARVVPPLVVKGGFHPCELLHGPEGTASVYADILFAFADGKIEEWSSEGGYTQISGEGPPWAVVVDEMDPPVPEQPEGAPLTEEQKARLKRLDEDIKRLEEKDNSWERKK